MGLDMYLHKRPKGEEIGYWRKHNRLHGWMEHLWEKRGNTAEFNCVDLLLDNDDLNQLQKDIEEQVALGNPKYQPRNTWLKENADKIRISKLEAQVNEILAKLPK